MKRIFLLTTLLFTACVSTPKTPVTVTPSADRLHILTLNAENLFDTDDDPEKNDETFLPARVKQSPAFRNRCLIQSNTEYRADECLGMDWSERALDRKFRRLTDILVQVNGGQGPDILILQEIENRHVLELWRERYLKNFGYITISHIEGPDERGIDTAVMSRLPLAGDPKLHVLDYSKEPSLGAINQRPTRGILETPLRLPDGVTLTVFAVHFPSQGAPTIHRKVAVENLLALIQKVPPGQPIVAGGDFNITSKEEWKEKYFKAILAPKMSVSHMVGCYDCAGTTYWGKDKTWSFFDVLLFSKDLDGGEASWRLDRDSIHIVNTSRFQTDRYGHPAHYGEGKSSVGVTDHYPMYAELVRRTEPKAKVAQ